MSELIAEYVLQVGGEYAIQFSDGSPPHSAKYLGMVEIDETNTWLAFEVGLGETRIKFYNPDYIRSLLPEKRP